MTRCVSCHGAIDWIDDCPTGPAWSHRYTPIDGHVAKPSCRCSECNAVREAQFMAALDVLDAA